MLCVCAGQTTVDQDWPEPASSVRQSLRSKQNSLFEDEILQQAFSGTLLNPRSVDHVMEERPCKRRRIETLSRPTLHETPYQRLVKRFAQILGGRPESTMVSLRKVAL